MTDFLWREQVSDGRYTKAMWDGEEPATRNCRITVNGETLDRWDTMYGVGLTYPDGRIFEASLLLPQSTNLYIRYDGILNIGQVLATKCKQWTNAPDLRYGNFTLAPVEEYTEEEVMRILNKLPAGRFYVAVRDLVWDIYKKEEI